ncbi:hypothetical protein [Peptostreptococcus anaerobius]|jgi:hypothetical protein|uniref:hypothetical protein n=1 Tax=Peptostreptococcus anaerobius TaxID=1261 RepID=UPI0034A192FD
MVSLEEMRKAEGHQIRIVYTNGVSNEDYCSYYMHPVDDEEEALIFIGEHYEAEQSDIESITILD